MDRGQSQDAARPRFTLVTPEIEDAEAFASLLAAACEAADVAAVILRLAPAEDSEQKKRIRTLAPAPQKVGAAVLLDGMTNLVSATNADGAFVRGPEGVVAARSMLKGDLIVGTGNLETRHDAMTAGDSGADFVMFGEPDADGRRPALPALVERVTWWAELFVVPCVAYAARIEEIEPLVRAGADFIALGSETVWNAAEGPAAALAAAARHIEVTEPAE
ncbi:MAG: thiamine phosphate synthase [Bradyrhizobiaceae bacterium]|nr:thiamine phosphate synthase [Bradyrhizobiaceae bacterium]